MSDIAFRQWLGTTVNTFVFNCPIYWLLKVDNDRCWVRSRISIFIRMPLWTGSFNTLRNDTMKQSTAKSLSSPSRIPRLRNLAWNFDKRGSAELPDLVWKIAEKPIYSMAMGYFSIFLVQDFHFWKWLGHRMSNFSVEFAFAEPKILDGLFRAVFEWKICIFWTQNFYFWVQNFNFFSTEFAFTERWISILGAQNSGGSDYEVQANKQLCEAGTPRQRDQ